MNKILLKTLLGDTAPSSPPLWFMRQAGRYLPEYLKLREEAGSFLNLCFSPEKAKEVTLQPLRRFPEIDAAILFSDILVVPLALGYSLAFKTGEGPVLEKVDLDKVKTPHPEVFLKKLSPIFETIRLVKKELPEEKTLLGFAGAPWTVLTYMIEGGGSKDHQGVKKTAFSCAGKIDLLIDVLIDFTILYLEEQIKAGVDAVQLFDSWAGVLPEPFYDRWIVQPIEKIVTHLREKFPKTPIIVFPKGNPAFYKKFFHLEGVCLSVDSVACFDSLVSAAPKGQVFQGGLDPSFLVAGGHEMLREADRVLRAFSGRPYVFNLSHGMTPDVPVSNVRKLIDFVKTWCP
jgi:uroporphyrinogen decarboxylase